MFAEGGGFIGLSKSVESAVRLLRSDVPWTWLPPDAVASAVSWRGDAASTAAMASALAALRLESWVGPQPVALDHRLGGEVVSRLVEESSMLPAFEAALQSADGFLREHKGQLWTTRGMLSRVVEALRAQSRPADVQLETDALHDGALLFDSIAPESAGIELGSDPDPAPASAIRHTGSSRGENGLPTDGPGACGVLADVVVEVGRTGGSAVGVLGAGVARAMVQAGRPNDAVKALRIFFARRVKGLTRTVHEGILEEMSHHGMAREAWELVTRDMASHRFPPRRYTVHLLLASAVQGNSREVARLMLGLPGDGDAEVEVKVGGYG